MRANDVATLKKQPIGSDENGESCDQPGNDSLENRVEAHEPRKHYFFEAIFFCHTLLSAIHTQGAFAAAGAPRVDGAAPCTGTPTRS